MKFAQSSVKMIVRDMVLVTPRREPAFAILSGCPTFSSTGASQKRIATGQFFMLLFLSFLCFCSPVVFAGA